MLCCSKMQIHQTVVYIVQIIGIESCKDFLVSQCCWPLGYFKVLYLLLLLSMSLHSLVLCSDFRCVELLWLTFKNSAGITEGFSMCGGDFVEVYSDPSQAGRRQRTICRLHICCLSLFMWVFVFFKYFENSMSSLMLIGSLIWGSSEVFSVSHFVACCLKVEDVVNFPLTTSTKGRFLMSLSGHSVVSSFCITSFLVQV